MANNRIPIPYFRTFPRWKAPLAIGGPPTPANHTYTANTAFQERCRSGPTKQNEELCCLDPDFALLACDIQPIFDYDSVQQAVLKKPLNAIPFAKKIKWADRRLCAETAGVQAELAWNFHREIISVDPHTNAAIFGQIPHYAWRAYMELPLEPEDVEALKEAAQTHPLYAPLTLPAGQRIAYIEKQKHQSRASALTALFLTSYIGGPDGSGKEIDTVTLLNILNSSSDPLSEHEKEILTWTALAEANQFGDDPPDVDCITEKIGKNPQWLYHLALHSKNTDHRKTYLNALINCQNATGWILQLGADAPWTNLDNICRLIAEKDQTEETKIETNKWKFNTTIQRENQAEDQAEQDQVSKQLTRETSINEELPPDDEDL
jgi:hypothetical protein